MRLRPLPILVGLLLLSASNSAAAQLYGRSEPVGDKKPNALTTPRRIQLTAHVGAAFGGKIEGTQGRMTLEGGPSFGLSAGYTIRKGGQIRLSYTQQKNQLFIRRNDTGESRRFEMPMHGIQIGGALDMPIPSTGGRLWPHFGLTLGATQFQPDTGDLASSWTFSWLAEGGLTFWIVRFLGINALIRWHGHVVSADNAAFCGSEQSGCVLIRSTELLFQGEAGGGVTLAF